MESLSPACLRRMFELSVSPTMVTDDAGIILATNKAFEILTGFTFNETKGKTPRILRSGSHDATFYQRLWQDLQEFGKWEGEIIEQHANGGTFSCWVQIERLYETEDLFGPYYYIASFRDLTEERLVEQSLYRASNYDLLTRIPNRNLFLDHLRKVTYDAHLNRGQIVVICMDLDHFKTLNESLGVRMADDILLMVGDRLQRNFGNRSNELASIARTGGDEFALFFTDIYSHDEILAVVRQLQKAIQEPFRTRGVPVNLTCSCGVSQFPESAADADELIRNAQHALDVSRKIEPNSCVFYDRSMAEKSKDRMRVLSGLRQSVSSGGFELFLQPKISTAHSRVVGAEALLRWHDPQKGLATPDKFIQILEESELIHHVGQWVIQNACELTQKIHQLGFADFQIAVNVSQRQFLNHDLYSTVQRVLETTQLKGQFLELEITESTLAHNPSEVIDTLEQIKKLGVSVAMDDFGTGFSSLATLSRFPLDTLKIDRAFIRDIGTQKHGESMVSTIMAIANSMDLTVVAEGVETEHQLAFMRGMRCDVIQGFYYSKPLPFDQFTSFIQSFQDSSRN